MSLQEEKERFISLAKTIDRPGLIQLLDYLETETDFYTGPASTAFHGAEEGGLLVHSLAVYDSLMTLRQAFSQELEQESACLCALFHDLCKANFYRKGFRYRKNETTGQWEKVEVYEIDDQLPLGHGEKSVMLLQKFIPLTEEEMLAIRWHMGGFDDTARSYAGGQSLSGAMKRYALVPALHMADMATCYFAGK